MKVREFLEEMRKEAGLSQKKFAEKVGIPFRTIQDWELGNRVPPEYVVEMLAKTIALEKYNVTGYSFNEYSDKGGIGTERIFKTKSEALKEAEAEWDHLSERDKDSYRQDPAAFFGVEEVSLEWDDVEMEFVRDNEAGANLVWEAF